MRLSLVRADEVFQEKRTRLVRRPRIQDLAGASKTPAPERLAPALPWGQYPDRAMHGFEPFKIRYTQMIQRHL